MCAVSQVTQHYYEQFPMPQYFPPISWEELRELRRKAAIYDKEHGQEDCIDPEKDKWFESVRKLMENSKFFENKGRNGLKPTFPDGSLRTEGKLYF